MRIFLLKAKHFIKRNIYPITVSLCTVLVLSIITVSAYTSIKNSNSAINVNQSEEKKDANEAGNVDDLNPSEPVGSTETIIFELPFEKATISKEYTDTKLLYDATTKMWCTHQGIDFACAANQEVKAVYDGKITKIESSMMNGTVVYLKVSDDLVVVYKGLSSEHNLKEGQEVKKGDVLGKIVSFLAEKADGLHLHLELLKADKPTDPTEYFSFNK